MKRVDRALDILSQVNYHKELVKLFLDIDDLPRLTDVMRLTFHREIINLHFHKKEKLNKARKWAVGYYNLTRSGLNFMNQLLSFHRHFMTCVVNDDNALFGYLLLKEEPNKSEVQDLLSVSNYSDLNLFLAGFISYKDHTVYEYISGENAIHATLGDEKLVEQEPDAIILKTPTRCSNYLRC